MKRIGHKLIVGDARLLCFMNHKIRCGILDKIMPAITHLGGAVFTISFTLSLILFGSQSVQRLGWEVATSLVTSHLAVHVLKRKVNRPRPHTVLEIIEKFEVPICDYSFPSGHTTAAFAVANILALHIASFSMAIMGLATLVAISRMYVGVHYPSDVLVGYGVASVFAWFSHNLFHLFVI